MVHKSPNGVHLYSRKIPDKGKEMLIEFHTDIEVANYSRSWCQSETLIVGYIIFLAWLAREYPERSDANIIAFLELT